MQNSTGNSEVLSRGPPWSPPGYSHCLLTRLGNIPGDPLRSQLSINALEILFPESELRFLLLLLLRSSKYST
jgi:hypothetical protein